MTNFFVTKNTFCCSKVFNKKEKKNGNSLMGPNFIYKLNYFILKEKLTDAIII